ncbi:MAG: ATP-binding protein [Myxococcales bacterium]|nr:ATP-binding protein [Myxococcales bacterium]
MDIERNNRILIVDDNRAIHDDLRKVLGAKQRPDGSLDWIKVELLGEAAPRGPDTTFELDSAFQGQEGLAKVRAALDAKRPFALAFVDIRMPPGWDGVETIEHLWKADPELGIVICSAYSDYGWDEIAARLAQTDRFLVLKKPFERIEVVQIAHALTRKWSLRRVARLRADELAELAKERTRELEAVNNRLAQEMRERQQMQAELRLAQKLEAVGQLAAGIAHEINTPMQYIGDNAKFLQTAFGCLLSVVDAYQEVVEAAENGNAGSLALKARSVASKAKLKLLRTSVPEALESTTEGLRSVSRIIRSMKDFSHAGSDEMTPADLNASIDATITISRNEWKYVADVVTELDQQLPLVPCHSGQLSQVVLNLLVNAAHAIEDVVQRGSCQKGKILIQTRALDDCVEISIADTGGGIPATLQEKVFDPFFTTKEVGRGTGQGLAIARNIVVEKHGGSLTFETEQGRGTTFRIRLPLAPIPHQGT